MNQKVKQLLQGKGNNHILPFLWVHGEEEAVLREYMGAIAASGIGAVCIESRPHPDYCGPQWWHDLDIILDEAKKRDMKVWILDDSHFPTGFANGALKDAPAELCRQYLYYSSVQIVGPMKSAQLDVSKHSKYAKDPFSGGSIFSMAHGNEKRQFDDDKMVSVCAARIDKGFDASTLIDITDKVKDGQLVWDIPEGKWMIYINFLTRNAGAHDSYINMIDKRSARKQIEAVYVPHYEHYKEEFGKTLAGFFSDEPELGNGQLYSHNNAIGADQDLPWSDELEEQLKLRLGEGWKGKLPLLWMNEICPEEAANMRYVYMDIVTRLVEEDFSKAIGSWCEERGVLYIGHLIEDNNSHARLGSSLGHFFRGLSGQHMSGIDDIGGQVMPGGEVYPKKALISGRDGEFYHYMLGKLGSSFGAIDPQKKGRTMCEIFGAYGWSEGVRMMKYLVDHFLVRGVNEYVPHAFSCKPYPDPDCPPHFYANGHDPQFRHFGVLMRYLNRMSDLISDGIRVTPAAILYHAEAEWAGNYMLDQKPAKVLMEHQIDFDIIPTDVFVEVDRYRTKLGKELQVNKQTYKVLVVPYAQFITDAAVKAILELRAAGFPVLFINSLPEGVVDGDNQQLVGLSDCQVVTLEQLAGSLKSMDVPEITLNAEYPMLRYLHYREESDLFLFTNEDITGTFEGSITVPGKGKVYEYDVWKNELRSVRSEQKGEFTTITAKLPPYQSLVLLFDEAEDIEVQSTVEFTEELSLKDGWRMSLAKAIDYPKFQEEQEIDRFENVGLKYPEFSGIIRYENTIELSAIAKAELRIEDAFEGVEVFVNDESVGIQVVKPFAFDLSKTLREGVNKLRIEVATTLERERYYAPADPADFMARLSKAQVLESTGIIGEVTLAIQK